MSFALSLFLSHTFAAFVFVGFFLAAFQFYWHKVKIKMQLCFHSATVLSACGNQLSSKRIDKHIDLHDHSNFNLLVQL